MDSATREIKQLARRLSRSPGFTLIAVATLALGIGANAAIFTVVNSVLIQPLPFPNQETLFSVHNTAPGMELEKIAQSEATYFLYSTENRVFQAFGVMNETALNVTGGEGPERISATTLSHEVLPMLGALPSLGRLITAEDDRPGAPEVVVLSHAFWQRRFGGDPSVVGRTMEANGVSQEIIGVLPPGFGPPILAGEVFVPLRLDPVDPDEGSFNYEGLARLRAGLTEEAAEADLARMIRLVPERFSGEITRGMLEEIRFGAFLVSLKEEVVGEASQSLWILLSAVGLVLLIACANVANLFLVRAEGRQKEVAVRTALGASGGHLSRHFLSESLVLGLAGGAVGVLLAAASTRALVAFGPENLPRLAELGIDVTVLIFTLLISLLAGLFFGLFPVVKFRRPDVLAGLKEGGRGSSTGRERHRARNALVVSQVALALVLLVGSGLMLRSFQGLRTVDPGFETENVLTLRLILPEAVYPDSDRRLTFHHQLTDQISALPGVTAVGAGQFLPLTGERSGNGTWFEDYPLGPEDLPEVLDTNRITAGFMEAMGMRLAEGRLLDPLDARNHTGAAVVTRSLARQYWPNESALGKRLTQNIDLGVEQASAETPWHTVVGVVEDVRSLSVDRPAEPALYLSLSRPDSVLQVPQSLAYAVRTSGPPEALVPAVRQVIWSLDPELPIARLRTMEEVAKRSMARTSFTLVLLGIAAVVALLLGAVGIYGVISYVVSQQTREIGVRMALGAEQGEVLAAVLKQGGILAAIGIGLGLVAAFGLTRLMEALLFGVSARDPLTFGSVTLVLALVALLSAYLPARRAAGIDPMEALRYE